MPQEQSASRNARAIRALSRSPISRAHSAAAAQSNHASNLSRRSSSLPSDALSWVALYSSDGPTSTTTSPWSWSGSPLPPTLPTAPIHGPFSPETLSSLMSMDSDVEDVVPKEPIHIESTPISPMSSVYPTSLSASSYVPASSGTLSYGSSFVVYEDVDMASDTGAPAEEPQMDPQGPHPYFPSSDARRELHLITARLCEAEDVYLSTACNILTDNQYAFEDSARLELHLLTARLRDAENVSIAAAQDISVDMYCLYMELGVN
ncbi:hypothetical protein BDN71DRAFT_1514438 [Pleurotus eryngii]|uniref:Uncharacterized protein n=1 Tax=Pleurotus eryngii TaxID=5323 RepID=A0A9P5ZGE6_PLEER|nr:hypothetical protein BDN71DRAFT_1514438 [Pleurotus eryngii]